VPVAPEAPTKGKDLTLRLAHLKYDVHRSLVYRWAGDRFRTALDPGTEQLVIPASEIPRLEHLIREHTEKQELIKRKRDVIEFHSKETGKPYDSIKRQFNRYLKQGLAFGEVVEKFIPGETLERIKQQANEF